MFVAFTVVAVWLGWNVYKVRERKAALQAFGGGFNYVQDSDPLGQTVLTIMQSSLAAQTINGGNVETTLATASTNLPILRRWLGDKAVSWIAYKPGVDPERMAKLFPDADIIVPDGTPHDGSVIYYD